jgi:hypothetical protein
LCTVPSRLFLERGIVVIGKFIHLCKRQ